MVNKHQCYKRFYLFQDNPLFLQYPVWYLICCKKNTIELSLLTQTEDCVDIKPKKWCNKQKAKNKCQNIKIYKKCKKTCDECGTQPPTCEDTKNKKYCRKQLNKNNCHKSKVKKNCKKTCGKCEGKVLRSFKMFSYISSISRLNIHW